MAITIVATAGDASANSYATLTDADSYLAARLNAGAWSTNADDKAKALIEATRTLDLLPWKGGLVTSTQALQWPRDDVPDPDLPPNSPDDLATDAIPRRVRDATIELAMEFLKAGTTDLALFPSQKTLIRRKTGPLESEWDPGSVPSEAQGLDRFPRVLALIDPLLDHSRFGVTTVVRV